MSPFLAVPRIGFRGKVIQLRGAPVEIGIDAPGIGDNLRKGFKFECAKPVWRPYMRCISTHPDPISLKFWDFHHFRKPRARDLDPVVEIRRCDDQNCPTGMEGQFYGFTNRFIFIDPHSNTWGTPFCEGVWPSDLHSLAVHSHFNFVVMSAGHLRAPSDPPGATEERVSRMEGKGASRHKVFAGWVVTTPFTFWRGNLPCEKQPDIDSPHGQVSKMVSGFALLRSGVEWHLLLSGSLLPQGECVKVREPNPVQPDFNTNRLPVRPHLNDLIHLLILPNIARKHLQV
ncbi:hypothetical protein BDN72DRAFT_865609 [Pluteus cervinus]|uniref:Uncharacterized protein n=1 Tax=Pluteus cervinus TaxID=181527 RepID=A0ACD3A0F9_9AGAR|nr:hypothetical protein BDN72DRAFT_865609 [Pluteus cervinus]